MGTSLEDGFVYMPSWDYGFTSSPTGCDKMEKELKPAKIVDVRGTICPGALWEMLIAYKDAKVGDIIAVYSSDPSVKDDAPAWVDKSQNELVGVYDRDGYYEVMMRKTK